MERRQTVRCPTRFAATLTLLEGTGGEHAVTVENLSGCGACISLAEALPTGATLKLVFEDCILLGETSYCYQEDDRFVVGLRLEQSLSHVSSLRKLMEALLEESPAERTQRRSSDRERR